MKVKWDKNSAYRMIFSNCRAKETAWGADVLIGTAGIAVLGAIDYINHYTDDKVFIVKKLK